MTRDRKQKYWLKDLIWLSKVLVHGFRRALFNTGLSRQLQGSFSFSQARLSVTIHQVTARSSSALSTVRNEETETELQGSPADTLLQAGAHCTAGKEQGHQKHGEQAQLQFIHSPWKWQLPLVWMVYTGLF